MYLSENKIASVIRQHGYKITPQRRAILKIILKATDHLTPAAIYRKASEQYTNISLVTTYRTLDLLSGLGLLCRVHSEGNCHNYLLKKQTQHHHHLVCSGCGTVLNLTNCELNEQHEKLSIETGFEIVSHLLEFRGRCPSCRQKYPVPE